MDPEIKSTILIFYDSEQYVIEYVYYSVYPDGFEIREIYDASGETIDNRLYKEIEKYCQNHILEQIREDLMARGENFKRRIKL